MSPSRAFTGCLQEAFYDKYRGKGMILEVGYERFLAEGGVSLSVSKH